MSLALRPSLFWDTDVNTIDLEIHKSAIIQRVVLRGSFEEFKQIIAFYGKDQCKEILLNSRWLDPKTLAFCSLIFDAPLNQFRCYTLAQLNPEHLNY
jgi:hypothetical protein